jgi:hypothetical protein
MKIKQINYERRYIAFCAPKEVIQAATSTPPLFCNYFINYLAGCPFFDDF